MKRLLLLLPMLVLLSGCGKQLPDYAESYLRTVEIYEAQFTDCRYALIDFDGDETPELLAGQNGYFISIFDYSDGKKQTLADCWPYGVMGNNGYDYLPGKAVVRNFNSDLAGAIVYESYWKAENGEMVDALEEPLSIWYFVDKNHNYLIDSDEASSKGEAHYFIGEREVSLEEYAAQQIPGDFEFLSPTKTADELLADLEALA